MRSGWARWRVRTGYLVGAVSLALARPTPRTIWMGAAIALAGLLIRAAAAGHLRKGEALATTGPYARTRNPLYLGSVVLGAAFAVASRSWLVALLIGAYLALFYPRVMAQEEAELRQRYGAEYDAYAERVPRFWPKPAGDAPAREGRFSVAQYARNHEYRAAIGTAALLAALYALAAWRR